MGKEYCEIFCDGLVYVLDDYKKLVVYGKSLSGLTIEKSEKGQYEELEAFYDSIMNGDGLPIPIWQLEQTSKISILSQNYD